jgi:hypothetical protein
MFVGLDVNIACSLLDRFGQNEIGKFDDGGVFDRFFEFGDIYFFFCFICFTGVARR